MISTLELRIGNLAHNNDGHFMNIREVSAWEATIRDTNQKEYRCLDLHPITITHKLLLAFDMYHIYDSTYSMHSYQKGILKFHLDRTLLRLYFDKNMIYIHSIHHLQNLFYYLVGTDLISTEITEELIQSSRDKT